MGDRCINDDILHHCCSYYACKGSSYWQPFTIQAYAAVLLCSEPAVSRLYASLGLGYDAPNTVDDDDFANGAREGRPLGHARLQPASAGRNPHDAHRQGVSQAHFTA